MQTNFRSTMKMAETNNMNNMKKLMLKHMYINNAAHGGHGGHGRDGAHGGHGGYGGDGAHGGHLPLLTEPEDNKQNHKNDIVIEMNSSGHEE